MSQTEVQLIKADAVQTTDIANSAVTDAKISGLTSSKLTGALPAISGASLTGITAGITEADCWRLSTTLSNNADNDITANWERNDTEFEKIGTGLSESSGVYSFPSTGKYLLMFRGTAQGNGDKYIGIHIYVSTNGGAGYTYRGESYGSAYTGGGNTYTSYAFDTIIDVTDASNFRFKWRASSIGTCNFLGNSNAQLTGFTCIKLGGT